VDHWRAHPEDLETVPVASALLVGSAVRVKPTVARPRYDWPDGVNHASVRRSAGWLAGLLAGWLAGWLT
jgi:hypothetical protein